MSTNATRRLVDRPLLWLSLVGLAVAALLLLVGVLHSVYRDHWRDVGTMTRSQAGLLEVQFDATLRRIDATLADIADSLPPWALEAADDAAGEAIRQRLANLQQGFPEVAGLRIFDAAGDLRFVTGAMSGRVNVADRDYFRHFAATPDDRLYFSEVVRSRITGADVLVVARALRGSEGQFVGLVSAAVDLGYFERWFANARPGSTGVLAVRRRDTQALVVRFPRVDEEVNRRLADDHPVALRMAGGDREATLTSVMLADNIERLFSVRALENYPFYVVAGISEAEAMAGWRQRLSLFGGLGAVIFVALGGVLFWLFRLGTREREAGEALRKSQQFLNEAQHIAQVGSWEINLVSGAFSCSAELYRIFGLSPVAEGESLERFLKMIPPDERSQVEVAYRRSLEAHVPYDYEHRIRLANGELRLIRSCGTTFYSPRGTPYRSVGTAQDITGMRRVERQLKVLGSAFEHSGEAILIADANNKIVMVNPAFTRLTGYTPEEALGRNPRFLSAGRNSREDFERMWREINENDYWQGEIWDRRKDGGVYPKWMSISVIREPGGKLTHYVAHFTDVTHERAQEQMLHHMAHHDALTGLLNRFSLASRLEQEMARARREGSRLAILFIDLDRFKTINDTLGHHVGDELLIQVARRLGAGVRESDAVARLGGDEFVVMLAGVEQTSGVSVVAEKLVAALGLPYQVEGHELYTTPSLGIAIYPTDGNDAETLMKNADSAMYHAKSAGRNNFQFFDARMNEAVVERLRMEHGIRHALAHNEFVLHYQPVVDAMTGCVVSVEALVRWQHPEHGLLGPARFIGIAEETGLIQPLGEWVFWAACRQLADFVAAGIDDVRMAINISAIQLRNGNLPVLVQGALAAHNLPPGLLVLEITESVAMHQPDETVRLLDMLHAMGVTLAIDDFGTGYSSLGYLRMFPISHLKLDRSFVQEIEQGPDGMAICDATISLAHNLGLKVVAEGVETEAQLEHLRARYCDQIQGFYFSRPLPAEEVFRYIREHREGALDGASGEA